MASAKALESPSAPLFTAGRDWAIYALGWLVFLLAFAAVSWFQRPAGPAAAILSSLRVVLPAALLGVAVVRLCERAARRPLRDADIPVHIVAALGYAAGWTLLVNVTNNLLGMVTAGARGWRIPPEHVLHWHLVTGIAIYGGLAAATFGRARALSEQRDRLAAEARLMRVQLSPHFLFNTLHTVFALAQTDPVEGEQALGRLSRLLRYALLAQRDEVEAVALSEEWAFTEDYLKLESLRTDRGLQWLADLDRGLHDIAVPPFVLQPIVENAIRHGGSAQPGFRIEVSARLAAGILVLEVRDNGCGATTQHALNAPGLGLRATRARAEALGGQGAFEIRSGPGQGFGVVLRLPVRRATRNNREAWFQDSDNRNVRA